jgi:mannose-6-phosphate isomerase-like protein (cupin superfamily)
MRDIYRGLCVVVLAFVASAGFAGAQTPAASDALSQAKVFTFDQLPVSRMANGGESRDIVRGALATGEVVALHESVLPVGSKPNPQHKIEHSEFILIQSGDVEFEHGDKTERLGAGGVVYVAYGTLHTLKNVGSVPAKYFVIQIGGDTKK